MIRVQVMVNCKRCTPKVMTAVAATFLYLWAQHNVRYCIHVFSDAVDTRFTELPMNRTAKRRCIGLCHHSCTEPVKEENIFLHYKNMLTGDD